MFSFIETKLFTRLVSHYLPDDEYPALQRALADNPQSGAVVKGSGGVLRVRWGQRGQGERGGICAIYYV